MVGITKGKMVDKCFLMIFLHEHCSRPYTDVHVFKTLKKSWRIIHWLTYIAFIFATVHGILLGSNFQFLPVRIIAALMAVVAFSIFIIKRITNPKRKTKKQIA